MAPTRDNVLTNDAVHSFTKEIIRDADKHDPVDAIHDVKLALRVLELEYKRQFSYKRT